MSWRLSFHSAKLLFSYLIPYKVKLFRDAIFDGNIPIIRQLAAERPRLLQQSIDADGNTAIGLALLLGEVEIVKTLLELGSNPNVANAFDGNHPLVILAKLRSEENSKTLLLADLLLNAGSDPLYEVRYQADSAKRLDATQTPSYHETPLLCCVRFQNEDLLKKMIEHETDINSLNPETGTSALMLAAALGYHNICNILIDAGAVINVSDSSGNTPLHLAANGYGEQIPVVKTLLQHGADVNAINEDGFTPAMLAKQMDNDACFKILDSRVEENIQPPAYHEFESVKEEKQQEQNIMSFA
jgi:ankyrin repeat protein